MDETVAQLSPATAETAPSAAQPFDFRHPVFLSSGQWRKLRMELDEYAQSLAALLSTYFRLEFGLQVSKLETPSFTELASSLPVPTQLVLFKADPLRGICLVEVRPSMALAIVDRLLGGPGQSSAPERQLSDMEAALLDQFVEIVLSEWCKHWAAFQELKAHILGHENNGRFLQTSSGSTIMLAVTFDARLGEAVGQIQLAFPYSTLEPLVEKLGREMQPPPPAPAVQVSSLKWNRSLEDMSLNLAAQWPAAEVSTRTLLALKVGDILDLQPEMAEQIELSIGNVAKFRAALGTQGGKRAVCVTEILKA